MEAYCDSDEEVFFGPVTLKEVKKKINLLKETEVHLPVSSTAGADFRKKRSAGSKEHLALNHTFTPPMNRSKLKETWDRRSLDENAVKLFTEEEAPAPPPSPEKMEYNGSPFPAPPSPEKMEYNGSPFPAPPPSPEKMEYNGSPFPTPCDHSKVHHSRLHHIAEEDETDKLLGTPTVSPKLSILSKLSILTTMNDNLTEDLYTPPPVEQKEFDNCNMDHAQGTGVKPKPTEEEIDGRNILLEKMKEYEAEEQRIKSMKRGPLHKVAVEDSLTELSTDDLLILNDVENDDYFSEESSDFPAVNCNNIEIEEDDSDRIVPNCKELSDNRVSDLHFSRLVSERIKSSGENHLERFDKNFLGDFERRYGKHKLNEVLASLNSEEENTERLRPISPEYDDMGDRSYESGCRSSLNSSKTSHSDSVVEISILQDDFKTEVEQVSHDFGKISVADDSVTCLSDDDLSESARIISNESHLYNKQNSGEEFSEFGKDSKITDNVSKDNVHLEGSACNGHKEELEIKPISCARKSTSQNCSINSHISFSDRTCEVPYNSQEYAETKCTGAMCKSLQNNASNMGAKSYIMSDEYSLISEAESEPCTPNKKDAAYSTKLCTSLASFDELVLSAVDEDGGVLSVLSEAAPQNNSTTVDDSVTCLSDDDLSESARIISNESHLYNKQNSGEEFSEFGEDSKITDNVYKDNVHLEGSACNGHKEDLEIKHIPCARKSTLQDSSINSHTSFSDRTCEVPYNSQEYAETKCTGAMCKNLQNNASNMGAKPYIMSDEYSLISEAESEPCTPNKKDAAYSTKPCVSLASFDEKVLSAVDEDGGFLSVLSEAALLHASLTHHSTSASGKQRDFDLANFDSKSTHNQTYKHDIKINNTQEQNCINVTTKLETSNEPLLNTSGTNTECVATTNHPSVCTGRDLKESFVESMNIDRQDCDNLQMPNEDLEADNCAGETSALDDLSETDKEHLEKDTSFNPPSDTEKFNDTLEDMEMLLKYGYSYSISNNDEELQKSTHKSFDAGRTFEHVTSNQYAEHSQNLTVTKSEDSSNVTESKARKSPPKPHSTFEVAYNLPDCSLSPIQHNRAREKSHLPVIKKSTVNHDKIQPSVNKTKGATNELQSPFKVPIKPVSHTTVRPGTPRIVKQRPLPVTPIPSSPFKKTGYKKIVSPVGMYIHKKPSPSLLCSPSPKGRTIAAPPVSCSVQHTPERSNISKNNAENIDTNNICAVLPVINYKSAPALKLEKEETEKLPKMNDKIKKLVDIPQVNVLKHEGRLKVEPTPIKKFTSPKQMKCPGNRFNASDPEISVVVQTKVSRTNTVKAASQY